MRERSAIKTDAGQDQGFIDFYGYHAASGAWCFVGWINAEQLPGDGADMTLTATFQLGTVSGEPILAAYHRSDLVGAGAGIAFYVPGSGRFLGPLGAIVLSSGNATVPLPATATAPQLSGRDLVGRVQSVLATSTHPNRGKILTLLARQSYLGADTIAALSQTVLMDFDEAIFCPPDGLVLMGWLLAKPGYVQKIRLRSDDNVCDINIADMVPISRMDVVEAVGRPFGLTHENNGFIAFAEHGFMPKEVSYLEIETDAGELAYKGFPACKLTGLAAMRRILDAFQAQYVSISRAFDTVIGPSLARLNAERVGHRPRVDVQHFGERPAAPRCAVVVPLYGRIDFMEVQLALFAAYRQNAALELIYVLDDPPQRAATEILAESIWERFRLPFALLMIESNVGFAAASNIGLHHARADFVCFMNSDVFPGSPDWAERLVADLETHPDIGCIGPLLQYEDGSIQHIGMSFTCMPQFGNWSFPIHTRKGWRPPEDRGMVHCNAITGAAMIMRRDAAIAIGGFDEGYIIGDFEDSDLCMKVNAGGQRCAVDTAVRLYHLERKSQASAANRWRQNMTLYNAWRHQRTWGAELAAMASPLPGVRHA